MEVTSTLRQWVLGRWVLGRWVLGRWVLGRLFVAFSAVLAFMVFPIEQAVAHPHEFVEMRVEARFDADGRVAGFRYSWLFDEFFSAYAVEGQDKNKNGTAEPEELNALMDEVLNNIHPINYFTKFDENGMTPEFTEAVPISATLKKRQYFMTFDIPFKEAIDVSKTPMRFAIYDDEFYIAMNYASNDGSVSLSQAPDGCNWNLVRPDPGDEVTTFADSLGKTESGGTDLGIHFAEWVAITCK